MIDDVAIWQILYNLSIKRFLNTANIEVCFEWYMMLLFGRFSKNELKISFLKL